MQVNFYADPVQINGKSKTRTNLVVAHADFEKRFPTRVFTYVNHEILSSVPSESSIMNVVQRSAHLLSY